jgi:hypothetical protein
MNGNRAAAPMLYAALIVVGFLIKPVVGIAVVIVGAILLGIFYTVTSGGGSARRPPRNRR